MCIITVYDDLKDKIVYRFFFPYDASLVDKLHDYWFYRGLWIGIIPLDMNQHPELH